MSRSRRPVIESVLTYEPTVGLIECVASDFKSREQVVQMFTKHMLASSAEVAIRPLPRYSLNGLRARLAFPVDPKDRIEGVSVAMMRLVPADNEQTRIIVELHNKSRDDIWSVVEKRLGSAALSNDYSIRQARLVIRYGNSSSVRTRLLSVTISPPNRSSIKETTPFEQLIARKYLPRWGLVVDESE